MTESSPRRLPDGPAAQRRYDPTTGEWRTFATRWRDRTFLPSARHCPLCPTRDPDAPTAIPRQGYQIVVIDNPLPAPGAQPPAPPAEPAGRAATGNGLYAVAPAAGTAEVVVYCDRHELAMADLPVEHLTHVVDVWAHRYGALGARDEVAYVFVFENRGSAEGAPLGHPHAQILAYPDIPPVPLRELQVARAHHDARGTCVFCDVVAQERADGVRVVAQNQSFLAFVPFAARTPYEVHIAAKRHATSLLDLTDPERAALAALLKTVVTAYDALSGSVVPYVMSMHQAPTRDVLWLRYSHFHLEFSPLHRAAAKLRYLAGSGLGTGASIADLLPEQAADDLRQAVARAADRAPVAAEG